MCFIALHPNLLSGLLIIKVLLKENVGNHFC